MVALAPLLIVADGWAAPLAPAGCPIFHCAPEATGLVYQPFVQTIVTITTNDSLGSLLAQGCSGNGTTLTCLYSHDEATGVAQGTLKLLDATTLQPIWGSEGAPGSYDLDAPTTTTGQVPVNFADGSIAAGDGRHEVLYNAAGAAIGMIALSRNSKNLGLTPLSSTYGVVTQVDGVLTLVNLSTWQIAGSVTLRDPETHAAVQVASPSTATGTTLYAVATNPKNGNGFLYSVQLQRATLHLIVHSSFGFVGKSQTSPVVVTPSVSGLPTTLLLLHAPGLTGEQPPQNHLLGITDSPSTGLVETWDIPLPGPLVVTPTVDQGSQSLFYQTQGSPILSQNTLLSGAPVNTFNMQAIGGYPGTFALNGHLGASQTGSLLTLLLSGVSRTQAGAGAEYIMAFQPIASPAALLWSSEISSQPFNYTAAWNFAPSTQPGMVCPIAIADMALYSEVIRLCDY
jgi:hypothetical protein